MAVVERETDVTANGLDARGSDGLAYTEVQLEAHGNPKKCVDENVLKFIMTGILERIQSSAGGSLEDLIGMQTDWYDEIKPPFPL